MNMQEKADYAVSMVNPNMDRLREWVISKPSGLWKLVRDE